MRIKSGSIQITFAYNCLKGAKTREEIYEAFDKLYPILKSFKKCNVAQ